MVIVKLVFDTRGLSYPHLFSFKLHAFQVRDFASNIINYNSGDGHMLEKWWRSRKPTLKIKTGWDVLWLIFKFQHKHISCKNVAQEESDVRLHHSQYVILVHINRGKRRKGRYGTMQSTVGQDSTKSEHSTISSLLKSSVSCFN